jgi:hypothetical protein
VPEFKLVIPIAFIVFNRPDKTQKVFSEIAKAKPPKLLVICDGARKDRAGDLERVDLVRQIVSQVDWPCEVLTNFSDVNLGCKKRVSSGLDWVFKQVSEAIVLEDDCLPSQTFFRFCQEMLRRYQNDQRIGIISGANFRSDLRFSQDSYFFSKYVHIWGWASWSDRWQNTYDVNMTLWPRLRDENLIRDFIDKAEVKYWTDIFNLVCEGKIDTWDYQWFFANLIKGRVNITPAKNLISNIGFDAEATHTTRTSPFANLPTLSLEFPLSHPADVKSNLNADRFMFRYCFQPSLWVRMLRKFKAFNSVAISKSQK